MPAAVWDFTVGGYQVIKKWLSYRDRAVLGRDLLLDEARYLTAVVRRISAIDLMGASLDEGYKAARDANVPLA